ncbi:hypothetical protein GGI13_007003 [Coemansia sp. RSA 455]|nr:hypothetical protein GGI14_004155 [Coemansia sp. S680]KAJ2051367.1 hypothetical protein H4S04_002026 [Coemansia sp. S16]KAJ2069171.1 hypothetical protein GGI08_000493 [Coemansia sp. S2]KAJ2097306.1 hypothetical protein GGI09_003900 [Coemansia sp. S100]KAJ2109223.1 hypothetical protein GGI16_000814 [Coemansia sp. S142-1]KAJ2242324.1 hypothetical protein GGI13_007003 [Coemansia sp. RSA 455]KAJ2343041.1 hypothetical protein GGH92_005103 [Coemansia sp. RSA 2673]
MTGTIANNERVVLISGCSAGGIGHHLALELAAHGCRVFAGVRTLSKAQTLVDNPLIEAVELDVTDDASVDAAVAYVLAATGGRIDILVNNAGVNCVGPAIEAPLDQVQQVFNTNFIGLARLCRAVAPIMMDCRQGTIVNVGSVAGYAASPWFGHYTATKAAVHAYSDSLRMELAPFGVNVVVVAPGRIKSHIVDNYSVDLLDINTRYSMARPAIEKAATFSQGEGATSTSQFAHVVVPKILRSSPPAYVTYGDASTSIWCMYYVPPIILDYLVSHYFGTYQLAKDLHSPSISKSATNSAVVGVALAAVVLGVFYVLF